jgi:hypothetical protein
MDQSPNISLEIKCLVLEKELIIERIKKHIYTLNILKDLIEYNSDSIKLIAKTTDPLEISKIDYFHFSQFYFEFDNKDDDVFCEFFIEDLESLKESRAKMGIKSKVNKDYSLLRRTIRSIIWSMDSKYESIILSLSKLQQQLELIEQNIEVKKNEPIKIKNVKPRNNANTAKKKIKAKNVLRAPNRYELKKLCVEFAEELGLKFDEELKIQSIIEVHKKITGRGILTTVESVGTKLRILGYKKKKY